MKAKKFLSTPYIWAFTTYFTEGFPYTVIRTLSSLFFRDMGAKLETIGLTSLYGLPWILKFLWAPQVDRFGTKRGWLLSTQGILCVIIATVALFAPLTVGVKVIAILFFIGAIFSATHDTAIDGYYMEALDKEGQAKFVGYRVMAYRIAMMTGTGVVATIGTMVNWFTGFFAAAVLLTLFFLYHMFFLPRVEKQIHPFTDLLQYLKNIKVLVITLVTALCFVGIRIFYLSETFKAIKNTYPILKKIWFSHYIAIILFTGLLLVLLFRNAIKAAITKDPDSFYSKAFLTFIDREKIGVIFLSIIFLRTGEFMLSSMVAPFFVDLGIKIHYGWLSSGIGLPCSIVGALLGGFMISKYGLKKVLWPFLLLQNLTNVVYMFLALTLSNFLKINTGVETPDSIGFANLLFVAGVHGFDQIAGGLGTAVLMTLLMRLCVQKYKAAHYAIGTGFMSISGVFVGVLGGFLCSWFGYGYFFGISFVFSIPGMIAILYLPNFIFQSEEKSKEKTI